MGKSGQGQDQKESQGEKRRFSVGKHGIKKKRTSEKMVADSIGFEKRRGWL